VISLLRALGETVNMEKIIKTKKAVVRVRVVPIETVYSGIRRSLLTLDAVLAEYQKKTISKDEVDRAYKKFTSAMRKLGLSGK